MATIDVSPNPVQINQSVSLKVWTTQASAVRCVVEYSGTNWGSDEAAQWGNYWYAAPRFSQPGTITIRATVYAADGNVLDTGWAYLEVKGS